MQQMASHEQSDWFTKSFWRKSLSYFALSFIPFCTIILYVILFILKSHHRDITVFTLRNFQLGYASMAFWTILLRSNWLNMSAYPYHLDAIIERQLKSIRDKWHCAIVSRVLRKFASVVARFKNYYNASFVYRFLLWRCPVLLSSAKRKRIKRIKPQDG